jgi:hypothetical protein
VPGVCGSSTTVTINARNPTQVCTDATARSAIVSWTDAVNTTSNFCVNFVRFWNNINVGTASGPPPVWPTLAAVHFSADSKGPGTPPEKRDDFYGTDLDLDGVFWIVGRSTLMDRQAAARGEPRPTLPAKCPGVP